MPTAPRRPCLAPGCRGWAEPGSGYCVEHRKETAKRYNNDRPEYHALYRTARWKEAAKRWLRSHPLCVECERHGRVEAGRIVDHVIPHRGDLSLFWDQDNWQTLCHACHNRKTASEGGRGGRNP